MPTPDTGAVKDQQDTALAENVPIKPRKKRLAKKKDDTEAAAKYSEEPGTCCSYLAA